MRKKENLEDFNISPYYKGLLFTEKAPGTSSEAESTNPTAHDFKNLNVSSPYYKGLLYTEKVAVTGTTLEAESTTTTAAIIPHDLMININSYSPYYKGLLNQATSPDHESVNTMFASSSFSVKDFIRKTFSLKEMKEEVVIQLKDDSSEIQNNLMIENMGIQAFGLEPEFDFGPIQHPTEPDHEDWPVQFPMPHSFHLISNERMKEDRFSDSKTPETKTTLHKEDDELKAIESPVIMVRKRHHDHTNAIIPLLQTSPVHVHLHQKDG